jgi:cytochrome c553
MLHIGNRIAAVLALAIPLVATAAAPGQYASPTPAMVQNSYDDSAEALRLRSGSGDPVAGRTKSFLCQGCHGEDGVSVEPQIPKLAGQYGNYIAKQIRNFQAGTRSNQIMNAMAATIGSEVDLADIAAYFASQPKMEGNGTAGNPIGENIFMHGDITKNRPPCMGCHGVRGKGVSPTTSMYPVIGGQQREYIRTELIDFRAGERSNSPNGIMNIITKQLTDEEIDALADYISAQ